MSAEFRQRHMRVIELNENDVASQIRMNHGRELEVVDAALDQILQGLDAFAYVKQRPDSRLEDSRLENAQMFLAVRSFNSLHIARQLLEHGYYQQASALVRMAMEDQLVAEDAETHPPTLDALLDDKGSISSGDLTYGKMAERISPEAKKAWDEKYGDLSERAAHPRRLSLLALTTVRRTVRPGGHYDAVQVKVTFLYLLEQLGQVLRTVGLLTANVESPWIEGARGLAGKPLAGFRATPDRRIIVLYGMIVSVIRFKNPLLHRQSSLRKRRLGENRGFRPSF